MNARVRLTTLAVPLLVVAALLAPASAAPNNLCTTPPPNEPVVREVTVNQGVDDYGTLAWNKRTIVRAYLTKDICHDLDTVELRSAVLTYQVVLSDGTVSEPVEVQPTAPVAGLTLGDYGDGIVGGTAAHDPTFVIDGPQLPSSSLLSLIADLSSDASTAPFELRLQLRIDYRSVTGDVVTDGTKTHATERTFGRKQNALRIVLVPLVAGGHVVDEADVTDELYTLSRIAPIASGLKHGIEPGGPGLRHAWHPAYDISAYLDGAEGTIFCGLDGNAEKGGAPVMADLAEIYKQYNITNGATVDRVVGIVAPGLAPADTTCPMGKGDAGTKVAWARADSLGGTDRAGSLIGHELSHTVEIAHSSSPNAESEDRAFDSLTGEPIAQDRALMNFNTTEDWNDGATLLEPAQWETSICRLTPEFENLEACTTTTRTVSGDVGSTLAKDGHRFTLAGLTDGTPAGTSISSQEAALGISTDIDDHSDFRLVQRDAEGVVLSDAGVPVAASHQHLADGTSTSGAQWHFGIMVPTADTTAAYELWRGTPDTTDGVLLHRRLRNGAPTITSAEIVPVGDDARNVTGDELDEDAPALSHDGSVLAFSIDGALYVQPVGDRTSRTGPLLGTDPAWSADGRLAYLRGGDLRVVTVTVVDGTPQLGRDDRLVYDSDVAGTHPAPASSPTWSPEGREIAVIIEGQIRALTADPSLPHTSLCSELSGCRVLQDPEEVRRIAWSGDDLMAFDDGVDISVFDVEHGTEPELFLEQVTHPRWGGSSLVSLEEGDGIKLSAVGRDAFGTPTVTATAWLVTSAFVTSPALSGDGTRAGWIETLYDSVNGTRHDDVMVLDTDRRRIVVDATDDDLTTLAGTVHLSCGGLEPLVHPLLVSLRPEVTGTGARFTADVDDSELCAGGELSFELNDGVQVDARSVGDAGTAEAPVVGIHEPRSDGAWTRYRSLPLAGAAFDRDGDAVDVAWQLHAPDGTETVLSTDPFPAPVPAPSGGWQVGTYTIVLRGTDTSGATTETRRTFNIVEDADGDGIPAHMEIASCLGQDADQDPSTPHGDPDGDGIPTAMDGDPCTSAVDVVADFEPDTLYVPSTGSTVSVRLSLDGAVIDGSVSMTRIGGFPVQQPALSVSTERDGTVVAKFDRQWLNAFLTEKQLIGTYVPIVITGLRADGTGFRALDPASPITSPG